MNKANISRVEQDDVFMTPAELTTRYKGSITPRTLANWRSSGDGPRWFKAGGRVLYGLRDVLEWEARRKMGQRG